MKLIGWRSRRDNFFSPFRTTFYYLKENRQRTTWKYLFLFSSTKFSHILKTDFWIKEGTHFKQQIKSNSFAAHQALSKYFKVSVALLLLLELSHIIYNTAISLPYKKNAGRKEDRMLFWAFLMSLIPHYIFCLLQLFWSDEANLVLGLIHFLNSQVKLESTLGSNLSFQFSIIVLNEWTGCKLRSYFQEFGRMYHTWGRLRATPSTVDLISFLTEFLA